MENKQQIVKKGSEEFKAAKKQYIELFVSSEDENMIRKGIFTLGEHEGKALGFTSKKILEAKLPMPFGCPDLFIQPCTDDNGKVVSVIWFCDRVGCLCSCCREDMTDPKEAYPTYCPDGDEGAFGDVSF